MERQAGGETVLEFQVEIISELDLRSTFLVTLSACETGISDIFRSPNEYIGLPAGFLQAGAPAIISCLWSVDDRSTSLLMVRFYRNHLTNGMSGPAALREAQLWLREATCDEIEEFSDRFLQTAQIKPLEVFIGKKIDERPYENPHFWAGFTYNGASI